MLSSTVEWDILGQNGDRAPPPTHTRPFDQRMRTMHINMRPLFVIPRMQCVSRGLLKRSVVSALHSRRTKTDGVTSQDSI